MSFSKIALSTVLGGLFLAAGLVLAIGPSAAGQLVLWSIVCTLGIGGVFWAGLAFGLGLLLVTLWEAFRGHHTPDHPEANPQVEALTAYVRRALQAGANDDQLLRRLQRQGWTAEEITQAIQRSQGNPDAPTP